MNVIDLPLHTYIVKYGKKWTNLKGRIYKYIRKVISCSGVLAKNMIYTYHMLKLALFALDLGKPN